jgi:hypothetical protein
MGCEEAVEWLGSLAGEAEIRFTIEADIVTFAMPSLSEEIRVETG